MITDADVKKLEKTFVTKKEFKQTINSMAEDTKTVIEMVGNTHKRIDDTNERMDKRFIQVDKRFDEVNKRLDGQSKQLDEQSKRLTENNQRLEENNKRLDEIISELRYNRIVLGSHESRLQKLEACSI